MWNHPVTPSAASTAASTNNDISSSSFPNELDFGASVDIQDEMCRTIKSECDEIDRSASIAQTAVKNEERTLHQLSKDYSCAKNEMASLRRDGGDILDEETMTDDIRRGFKEQFESEIVPHVTASNTDGDEDDAALVSEDEGANNEDHHGTKRVYAHGKFLARKNSELKAKKASMVATAQEIKSGFKNIQAVDDEAANILQMIETRGLDAAKGQGERTIAQLQREVEVENQRNRGVKEAIQAARANSGVNAQTIAEKAKLQMTLRSEHLSKEAELTARNDAAQQEMSLVQAEQKKLAEELALLSGQLDFFTQNVAEYEAKQKRSDEIKAEMEGVKSDIVELISKQAIVTKNLEDSSSELKIVEKSYDGAKEAYDTIMSEKDGKEKERGEATKTAEARRADAMKGKEILAGKIAKFQEETANQEGQGKDALSGAEARLVALSKTLKTREEQLEKKRAASDKLKEESASTLAAKAAQEKEMREMTSKFEAASKAEIDRLAVLKKERIESRVEHVEKRRSDLNLIEDCQRADIKNIRKKLGVLEEVNKIKDSIKESEIVLDKNGNDSFVMPNVNEIDFGDGFDFEDL
eukprot:CAMPEP_0201696758 /NCGR_PEP_ID=MMETSP0578-20130828/8314_1 /ASSEMBLY_ACC=CAM_ASM_000663 /TAXON_ID=267565 /ORGANISM="Skeletonema grethea, Strain CCMP 1804" /LENGTH=583 /DNA_ID=CAMNT_0048182787 /DNA_START=48 /DNA_END=1799 /DNA_ORIENTATION=+